MKYYLLFVLLVTAQLFAQQGSTEAEQNTTGKHRYLISPFQEVIPLDEKQSARMYIDAQQKAKTRATTASCSNTIHDGFTIEQFYPPYSNFGATHKDVVGNWYVANFSGTIDTVYWQTWGSVGALDSTVFLRIHKTNITPTAGPGAVPGPYNPPCQNWGYFINTNDEDQGIAAFKEDATDTTWISTYNGSTPSFEPFGEEIWWPGGWPVINHAPNLVYEPLGRTNFSELDFNPLPVLPVVVSKGDAFFISLTVNGPAGHVNDNRTEFLTAGFDSRTSGYQDYYPSRNWKFYEHDSGPSNCSGVPRVDTKKGWVARGGFVDTDPRSVAAFLIWYSIRTNDNTPPILIDSNPLYTTSSSEPRNVDVELEDCNPGDPASAGVVSAELLYDVMVGDDTTHYETSMTNIGGNTWRGVIPGQPADCYISYSVRATDAQGLSRTFNISAYRIIALNNAFFESKTDTCSPLSIKNTGTEIPSSAFFVAPPSASINPKDDGTAGPFPLGGPFYLFGQELNYVWVGVNGGIALSKTAAETLDVNANGSYTTAWDFPGAMKNQHRDTSTSGLKPRNFIAPFWNDFYYGDTTLGDQWGHIRYQDLGCEFVVEWGGDTLGVFTQSGDSYRDELTVRAILNKCNGSIVFQYDNIGTSGLDTTATIGIQCDTIARLDNRAPWAFINRFSYPIETKPYNGLCIKINQKIEQYVKPGWNIVSLAGHPTSDSSIHAIFPDATSLAFMFEGGQYVADDTLTFGKAYWLKFKNGGLASFSGTLVLNASLPVEMGWNLLGSVSVPLPISSITGPISPVMPFFTYDWGYMQTTTVYPGKGHWVVATANGSIELSANGFELNKNVSESNNKTTYSVTLIDASGASAFVSLVEHTQLQPDLNWYEAPPMPPTGIFDVRYKSGRFLEAFSDESEDFPLQIRDAQYPVTVRWNIQENNKPISLVIDGKAIRMSGTGSTKLAKEAKQISLRAGGESILPTAFALEQNYPNPFNPTCVIKYALPVNSIVTLKVYNILGQAIATLVDGEQEAGFKSVTWDASNFPSGVYMYTIHAETFTETRKMLLVR